MENNDSIRPNLVDYSAVIGRCLRQQYPSLSEKENAVLCREVIFAPKDYKTEIKEQAVPITSVRENLADLIERETANKNFIPYSLNAQIADLIEQSSCETSSMNEYYRWVSATAEIIRHTSDGEITHEDSAERKHFITISFEREAEILVCLALYEGSDKVKNQPKIDILRFKLARLRELRSIVVNTSGRVQYKKQQKEEVQEYYNYCQHLLSLGTPSEFVNLNLNIKLDISHSNDEDLDENYSHLDYLRTTMLCLMRLLELPKDQHENMVVQEHVDTKIKTPVNAVEREKSYER